ncbi:MAG: methionine--tRNA ligase [Armatimonadota bacterium]|nr:methionine--tRNA ligase [Armatimonadota bacterium]
MKSFTITTPIYYINDHPHLGTAYTTILADVLARFHRAQGEDVFFLTGTDENGEKIIRAAQDKGLSPRELVDTMSAQYRSAWETLDISYDRFIRTTDPDHVEAVQRLFSHLQQTGDIYKGRYEGWYCVHDETFFVDAPDGLCPECKRPLEKVQRDSYFFKLSRYAQQLLDLYESNPQFVVPEIRRNEVVRFIQDGLRDMSITRTRAENNAWGIPVPGDPNHVVYVWFDALVNYIAAAGYPDNPARLDQYWPAAVHIVGKDILVRFHATLWPAMLMGIGLALPKQIMAHGWLMINDRKMSKSLIEQQLSQWKQDPNAPLKVTSLRPGEIVRSLQEVAAIPDEKSAIAVDALRYFLVRDLPPGADAEFSLDRLVERYNSDLANDLGNLLNRTLSMLQRYRQGLVPQPAEGPMTPIIAEAVEAAGEAFRELLPSEAVGHAWKIITASNHYIDEKKPWVLQKESRQEELDVVLYGCAEACRVAAVTMASVMPSASREILRQLGCPGDPRETQWDHTGWGGLKAGQQTLPPEPVFPRIEAPRRDSGSQKDQRKDSNITDSTMKTPLSDSTAPAAASASSAATEKAADEISIDEFARVQIRIATIKNAERVEGARKLLRLILDVGDEERQIVSGIADQYEPEALIGRQIAVIVNLKPATIRGVQSFGMLLAADSEGKVILLQPDSPAAPGSRVR